jgi:hypothetical protein
LHLALPPIPDRVARLERQLPFGLDASAAAELGFPDSAGRRTGVLPISRLPAGRVVAALRRHDWPVPEDEDPTEPLSRWR